MQEQLISFETAKLTKTKGFEEPCFHYYKNGVLHSSYLENGVHYNTKLETIYNAVVEFIKWYNHTQKEEV